MYLCVFVPSWQEFFMEYEIKPAKGLQLNLKELWDYRELFYFFTWRDIKVKYKQTILGFAWAVLQPFIMMVVFSLFFGKLLKVPSDGIPYPVFVYSGLLLWNVFSTGLTGAGNSMVTNADIIKKIYFPRLIIPISSILVALFDFLMAFIVYIGILLFYQFQVSIMKLVLFLPVSLLITIITTFGLGSLLAALNVKYRDFRYVIPFLVQLLLFLTPVIYPVSIFIDIHVKFFDSSFVIKERLLQFIFALNPMSGAINLLRTAIINKPLDMDLFLISAGSAILLFIIGLLYFRKTEYYFADLV